MSDIFEQGENNAKIVVVGAGAMGSIYAGLFAEAGRIRQTYLENDKPMVQIGQIGDSVVKDSVIMGEQKSQLCPGCGVVIQPEWNFCPSCNSPL